MLSRADLIKEGVSTALTVGTALGTGILHGRKGVMPALGPIPLDAALGAGSALLGLSGALGKRGSGYVMDMARGWLAYFGGSIGAQVGQKMRKNAGELTGASVGTADSGFLSGSRTITKGLESAAPAFRGALPGARLTPEQQVRAYRASIRRAA